MIVFTVPKDELEGQCLSHDVTAVNYRILPDVVIFRLGGESEESQRRIVKSVEDGPYLRVFCHDEKIRRHFVNLDVEEQLNWADLSKQDHGISDLYAYHDWKVAVIEAILGHPAMQEGADSVVTPNFGARIYEEKWREGATVEDMLKWADEEFNLWGW